MFNVTLNSLGIPIEADEISNILDLNNNTHDIVHKRENLIQFFNMPITNFDKNILERYSKSSKKELYLGITPHNNNLLENIYMPYKSAKKCYCLAEYLATIQLCGQTAEMITNLINLIYPVSINSTHLSLKQQKLLFSKSFSDLDQDRRTNILLCFKLINDDQNSKLVEIRKTRNKYYHLWGHNKASMEEDAFRLFSNTTFILKDFVEVKMNNTVPQTFSINPALQKYLSQHERKPNESNSD